MYVTDTYYQVLMQNFKIIIFILIAGGIGLVSVYFVLQGVANTLSPTDETSSTFVYDENFWLSNLPAHSETLTVGTKNGERVPARNFLNDNSVVELGTDFYRVFEIADPDGPIGAGYFYNDDGGFILLIEREPLSFARSILENQLQQKLQFNQFQMCQLKILVQTTRYVNENFAGRNLGLSFCPGSVTLPNN